MSSVNTNNSAIIALQNLTTTQNALQVTQKRVSTGYNVSSAFDNGAVFAIAQSIRVDISGLGGINQQLQFSSGLLSVTNAALTNVSNNLTSIKNLLVQLGDGALSTDAINQLSSSFAALVTQSINFINGAVYQSKSLIAAGASSINVLQDAQGDILTLSSATPLSALSALNNLVSNITSGNAASSAQAALATTGAFASALSQIGTALNAFAIVNTNVTAQISFNQSIADSFTSGLGALVDADLSREAATLQSLQIKQQLGSQALSIANQTPQILLSLFR
jgi:flagellin